MLSRALLAGVCARVVSAVAAPAAAAVEALAFDLFDPATWPSSARYTFSSIKLLFAFSPIIALLCVFYYAFESDDVEKLKRNKKADFTFDSPE
ncbi:hypothetical protein M885DRAFT_532630 [Pelagophyceae sp. CCMP2097]|nr:hypothetical protein M885DRAFT_532630 [Pelagophyceae sp. CCMP2097]|mmetsp:Transcript_31813/g.107156  ORF Transcript_31813/g.107156 Transcript_31813/m.107156 type:complete len:93 (+) Transcript_31813:43-321(+)